ncbi:MAG: M48 family metalloprotease [Acidobacteriota bacterium]
MSPQIRTVLLAVALAAVGLPAYAQFGGFDGALKKAQQAKEQKDKLDDLTISDAEERRIGEDVSAKIRKRFGVVQDPAVHKYVTLVGTTLARATDRPNLAWTFVVLDTDGVNAFASPGGIVHITRGALGLIRSEAELAGVLGHEIGHVTHKHTVNAIRKGKLVQLGNSAALSDRAPMLEQFANRAYTMVLENSFDRGDELDADSVGVELTRAVGYAPAALGDFLAHLAERNKNQPEKNGLFASHPETTERIDKIRRLAGAKPGAVVGARYKTQVKYEAVAVTSIAAVPDGSSGLTGSTKAAKEPAPKEDAPKKKGFGLGALNPTVKPEKESTQVSASGGARGVGPDRAAKGGDNPALVKVTLTDADLAQFKTGIA